VFKVIFPLQYSKFRFQIFNRFGEKTFETNDINRGWDGRYKGQLQPIGVYAWQVFITETGKAPYFRKGIISLIR
jgi:gliding motility-associated-like protein